MDPKVVAKIIRAMSEHFLHYIDSYFHHMHTIDGTVKALTEILGDKQFHLQDDSAFLVSWLIFIGSARERNVHPERHENVQNILDDELEDLYVAHVLFERKEKIVQIHLA